MVIAVFSIGSTATTTPNTCLDNSEPSFPLLSLLCVHRHSGLVRGTKMPTCVRISAHRLRAERRLPLFPAPRLPPCSSHSSMKVCSRAKPNPKSMFYSLVGTIPVPGQCLPLMHSPAIQALVITILIINNCS